LETVQDKR